MAQFITPLTDRTGRFSALKSLTLLGLLAPALYLGWRAYSHSLGPLPVKEMLLVTGLWTVRFLVISLALTPLQRLVNWPRIALVRRMTGVAAFAYGATHFTLYIANSKYDLGFVAHEILARIYLTIGFVALLGLAALALTSTDTMLRRLGRWWKPLHRLVYGIAVLGILHYYMQSKIDVSPATLLAGFFLTLMIYRLAIKRRLALGPAVLAACALAGGLATALVEFAWYAIATGIDPWRIAKANLTVSFGLRPAVIVTLAGLAVALVPLARPYVPGLAKPRGQSAPGGLRLQPAQSTDSRVARP